MFASQIRQAKLKMENNGAKTLWVLIDALDSGLSIDNIVDVKENLFSLVLDDFKMSGLSVGFIVSAGFAVTNSSTFFAISSLLACSSSSPVVFIVFLAIVLPLFIDKMY